MSNSTPLIPLSEHVAMVQKLAPWLDATSAEEMIRDYKSYTATYTTPDGSEWAPKEVSYYLKEKIEKEYATRLYDVLQKARSESDMTGITVFNTDHIALLLGFVTLHAPELLKEGSTDTNSDS